MTSCLWNDCRLVAGRARSPTAAFWQSGLKHLGLADWPLSGNRYGGFGSNPVGRSHDAGLARLSHPIQKKKNDLRGGRLGLDEYLRRLIH